MDYGFVSLIVGTVSVLCTAIYAFLTYHILKANRQTVAAMQEQTEFMRRPLITLSHSLSPDFMVRLLVRNNGRMNAEKLKLSIDRDFFQISPTYKRFNLAENHLFREGVESFPPGSEIMFALLHTTSISDKDGGSKSPLTFTITAHYSQGKHDYVEKTTVDLRPYRNLFMPEETIQQKLQKLVDEIKIIKETQLKKSKTAET